MVFQNKRHSNYRKIAQVLSEIFKMPFNLNMMKDQLTLLENVMYMIVQVTDTLILIGN